MRLNAFLARAGVASRRRADQLIKSGAVIVNGKIGRLNDDVENQDIVKINNKQVVLRKSRYILLNKPDGYITTLSDPKNRRKVIDLINIPERIVPVGRLDKDTTGVLLLTNDGPLAYELTHPSFEVDKIYEAEVAGDITSEKLQKLAEGVRLDNGKTAPAKATRLSDNRIEMIIHEGRKHQVKLMLAAVGLKVLSLHRRQYGPLTLEGLEPGQWRDLTDKERALLKR